MNKNTFLAALALGAVALAAVVIVRASSADAGTTHQETVVNWHPQQAEWHTGQVDGAAATLVRNKNGIRYQVRTQELTADHAYTLWLVVVNEPGECAASPCTGGDILQNPATDSQVTYAAGHVAGGSGSGTFAGHVREGALDGWLDGGSLRDSYAAEVHLVVNDHGPTIPALMPGMIDSYRGGCSDDSPFPGVFPPSALADGEPGPNICRLYQAAIFLPEP